MIDMGVGITLSKYARISIVLDTARIPKHIAGAAQQKEINARKRVESATVETLPLASRLPWIDMGVGITLSKYARISIVLDTARIPKHIAGAAQQKEINARKRVESAGKQ